jgi:hypothetical protein
MVITAINNDQNHNHNNNNNNHNNHNNHTNKTLLNGFVTSVLVCVYAGGVERGGSWRRY